MRKRIGFLKRGNPLSKTKGEAVHQATEVTQVRPIAVGHAIYRLWGRIRLQQMAPFFANHLPPFQSGGCAGADLESMLVSLSLDLPGDTYQVGLALDVSKAFDPTDAYCALQALKSWGLPDSITNLLGNHWLDHFRWRGGPEAMMGCCSLPQGDVWSPLRLAPLLAATLRKQQQDFPQMGQMLYFDDRAILGALPAVVKQINTPWQNTGLKASVSWSRTTENGVKFLEPSKLGAEE